MKNLLLMSILLLAGTGGVFGDSIFISPASQNVYPGQSFTVGIDIDNIPDVFNYQFSLAFDPHVLAAQSVTEGALFANTGDSFFSPGTIDNSAGDITLVFDTLLSSAVGVAGPGTLATLQSEALAVGTSSINFSPLGDLILEDSGGNILAVSAESGSADVVPTPELATFVMIPTGFLLIAIGVWRKRCSPNSSEFPPVRC